MGRKDISRVESVRSRVVSEIGSDLDIRRQIFTVRGMQVMLDRDLAELYKVPTKRLNEQVKRNAERFPAHFMFRLSAEDLSLLRSQFATSNETALLPESLRSQFATSKRGGRTGFAPRAGRRGCFHFHEPLRKGLWPRARACGRALDRSFAGGLRRAVASRAAV